MRPNVLISFHDIFVGVTYFPLNCFWTCNEQHTIYTIINGWNNSVSKYPLSNNQSAWWASFVLWCLSNKTFSTFFIIRRCLHSHTVIYLTSTYSFTLSHLFIHSFIASHLYVHLFMLILFNMHVGCIQHSWLQSNIHFNLIRLISSLINSSVRWWFHTFPVNTI